MEGKWGEAESTAAVSVCVGVWESCCLKAQGSAICHAAAALAGSETAARLAMPQVLISYNNSLSVGEKRTFLLLTMGFVRLVSIVRRGKKSWFGWACWYNIAAEIAAIASPWIHCVNRKQKTRISKSSQVSLKGLRSYQDGFSDILTRMYIANGRGNTFHIYVSQVVWW